MNQPLVYVIILNFNGSRWLRVCLESLRATEYDNFKIVLVDNASNDGSVELVQGSFPEVRVVVNASNAGFSEGNNIGIKEVMAEDAGYVVLLNPDTKVTPRWLVELLAVGEKENNIGILGAVQLKYDSDEFNTWTMTALSEHLAEFQSQAARDWIEVEWVEGACFAIKREVIEQVGLLDPIYFAFYEEIDYCRRAAFHGYKIAIVPRSRIHHFRGGSWEANAAIKRERDYRCDRSQFIYNLTDPRRSLITNLGWYLRTLLTKSKEAISSHSLRKILSLLQIQAQLLMLLSQLLKKWQRDRS